MNAAEHSYHGSAPTHDNAYGQLHTSADVMNALDLESHGGADDNLLASIMDDEEELFKLDPLVLLQELESPQCPSLSPPNGPLRFEEDNDGADTWADRNAMGSLSVGLATAPDAIVATLDSRCSSYQPSSAAPNTEAHWPPTALPMPSEQQPSPRQSAKQLQGSDHISLQQFAVSAARPSGAIAAPRIEQDMLPITSTLRPPPTVISSGHRTQRLRLMPPSLS